MMGRYGHMGMLRIAKKRDRQIVTDALERVDMVNFRPVSYTHLDVYKRQG